MKVPIKKEYYKYILLHITLLLLFVVLLITTLYYYNEYKAFEYKYNKLRSTQLICIEDFIELISTGNIPSWELSNYKLLDCRKVCE